MARAKPALIQRAFAPPGPSVVQSLKVQGGGSPTLGLCSFNIPLEKPVGGLPGLGLFPTARESGFEQTAPGIPVPSWMAKAGVAGTVNAAATIAPAISFLIRSPPSYDWVGTTLSRKPVRNQARSAGQPPHRSTFSCDIARPFALDCARAAGVGSYQLRSFEEVNE